VAQRSQGEETDMTHWQRDTWPSPPAAARRRSLVGALVPGLVVALLLAACASGPTLVPVGASSDALLQSAGPPTGRLERNGQQRWEYATGPAGRFTWMVDLDAAGKVKAVSQVLTEANFATVHAGQTSDELRWQLGRPSEQKAIWRGAMLWQYRYDTRDCMWFVVTVETDGIVRDAGYLIDPACPDVNDHAIN
jgi:hypothetical protein